MRIPVRLTLITVMLLAGSAGALHAEDAPQPQSGTTIVGDQDAALGLFLAPWKDESRAELGRAPGLHDRPMTAVDPTDFARVSTYYAAGRAYRAERLQRNK